ncbi:MAG: efflux RND transporter periplasmic adaptor subunit [Rhodocyclaceae bacterium]|nr:efflux RND transporter periplasmic adaptor subunit [Rhodocyclaceae bacterium]
MTNIPLSQIISSCALALALLTVPASAAETQKTALTVAPVTPLKESWPQTLPISGEVAAWQESVIGSEVGQQRIVEVRAQVGDVVRKGALLARIADEGIAAELAQAEAALAEADALLLEAKANAERAKNLREKGFYSPQQGVQYETAQATALARRASAQAAVQGAKVRLAQTRIVAPDDGVISARRATLGSLTAQGEELFRLIRQSRLEWRAEVPEAMLAKVRTGMVAQVRTIAGEVMSGKVRTVSPSIDPRTRNGIVFVDLQPSAGKATDPLAARAGMFVRGEIELGRVDALTVPQSALVLRDGFAYLFLIDGPQVGAGGTAKVRMSKVDIGRRQADRVAVLAGLTPQAQVVATGAGFLSDGDTVRVEAGAK